MVISEKGWTITPTATREEETGEIGEVISYTPLQMNIVSQILLYWVQSVVRHNCVQSVS